MEPLITFLTGLMQGFSPLDILQAGTWDAVIPDVVEDAVSSTGAAINNGMINLCNVKLMRYALSMCDSFTSAARYLGAIFAMIVAARHAYKVMAEGDRFEILDVIRPIIFAFVLACWPAVCTTLLYPGAQVENYMRSRYQSSVTEMERLRQERLDKSNSLSYYIGTKKSVTEMAVEKAKAAGEDPSFTDHLADFIQGIGDGIKSIFTSPGDYFRAATMMLSTWIMGLIEQVIVFLGEIGFAVCVYVVFLLKVLYITVLVMFGPIYMVCSILDVWKDSWSKWVGRMIHVSFYGAMAYLVMHFSIMLIIYALHSDLAKLNYIAAHPDDGVAAYIQGGFGTTLLTLTGYVTGAIAMLSVGELASLTFPGDVLHGASGFIGGMQSKAKQYGSTGGTIKAVNQIY